MSHTAKSQKIGAVMVVGGGIAGIQASLDLAETGFFVHLVEKKPAIGGAMAQLNKTFPTNDCAMCTLAPKLVECGRHLNIQIHTLTEVKSITGEPGNFTAALEKQPATSTPPNALAAGNVPRSVQYPCRTNSIRACRRARPPIVFTPRPSRGHLPSRSWTGPPVSGPAPFPE